MLRLKKISLLCLSLIFSIFLATQSANAGNITINLGHGNSEGYKMNEEELDGKSVRLVAAWNTQEEDVEGLLETLKNSN